MTVTALESTMMEEVAAEETASPAELVRGSNESLLDRLAPRLRRESVLLDLGNVGRIDAAGISTLVSLYLTARNAGQRFRVSNASPHVEQTLTLVGLDRILLSRNAVRSSQSGSQFERSAA
jgi:anti-anti-sigma factor